MPGKTHRLGTANIIYKMTTQITETHVLWPVLTASGIEWNRRTIIVYYTILLQLRYIRLPKELSILLFRLPSQHVCDFFFDTLLAIPLSHYLR